MKNTIIFPPRDNNLAFDIHNSIFFPDTSTFISYPFCYFLWQKLLTSFPVSGYWFTLSAFTLLVPQWEIHFKLWSSTVRVQYLYIYNWNKSFMNHYSPLLCIMYSVIFCFILFHFLKNAGYDSVNWFPGPLMGCDLHFEKHSPRPQF